MLAVLMCSKGSLVLARAQRRKDAAPTNRHTVTRSFARRLTERPFEADGMRPLLFCLSVSSFARLPIGRHRKNRF